MRVVLLFGVLGCAASPTVTLSNELQLPLIGFGTAGGVGAEAVRWAYEAGVNLFDTAQAKEWYNEESVAAGLQGVPRGSYWLETKVHPRDLGFEPTLAALPRSLTALNTTYIDVFLLHFPRCFPGMCEASTGDFLDSWRAMEQLYRARSVRAIGVSNFDVRDLETLLNKATVIPHVVQNYFDPLHQDKAVRVMCEEHGIAYQGYSTLGSQWAMRTGGSNPVLTHEVVVELGKKYQRSPAQIVLAWALSRGVAVIPRSVVKAKIEQNANIGFDMEEDDLERIDNLDNEEDEGPDAEIPIDVVFVNKGTEPVNVFWRGPDALDAVADLAPGQTFGSQSYEGHNFVVQIDGNIRYAFDVSSNYPFYHLSSSSVIPHHEL
jgi:diketogulonate reductase-like aldo/keto reductase